MILVAGGSGRLGTLIVRRLGARGLRVRVLTRDRRRTTHLKDSRVLLDQTARASGRPVIFGRGRNPVNFVSVSDVAALAERAVVDPLARGVTFEIGGPQDVSFNELAARLQQASGRTAPPRHVPRPILRLLAAALGPVQPNRARQIRAALAMDTMDLTFALRDLHRGFVELPVTSLADILSRHGTAA